jgi:hypothetical protein
MAQQRRSTVAVCRAAAFDVQPDFLTALPQGDIDTRIPLSDEDPKLDLITDKEEILNCTGQELLDRILLTRMYRLTYGIKAVPAEIFGHFGWGFGVVAGDSVTLLPESEFQPPATTLLWGHIGSDIQPFILKSMVLMKISISAAITGYTINYEWLGHGAPEQAVDYDYPVCPEVTAARFKDGEFTVNSISRLVAMSGYDFSFDNKPDPKDGFTLASPDLVRNERNDRREEVLKCKLYGELGDALDTAGKSDPVTKYPFSFRIGSLTDGCSLSAVNSLFESENGESYTGGFKRSELNFILSPIAVSGNADAPLLVTRET